MKHLLTGAACAVMITAAGAACAAAQSAAGPWGFDLAGRDTAAAPGADFYQYVNGTYLKSLTIPPDRSRYGTFDALRALSETRVHALLDQASGAHRGTSAEEVLVGDFYTAAMERASRRWTPNRWSPIWRRFAPPTRASPWRF